MGWIFGFLIVTSMRYLILSRAMVLPENIDDSISQNIDEELNANADLKLEQLSRLLATVLVQPWPNGISPILYVEELPSSAEIANELDRPDKRTRYYRKYPWKRQNTSYDADRYLCQPSKEDVFRLLVALHDARQGKRGEMVNFCNRKRPATSIFTNIRFLG